jgi:hypothetical protein
MRVPMTPWLKAGLLAPARVEAGRDGRTPACRVEFALKEHLGRTGMDGLGYAAGRDAARRPEEADALAGTAVEGRS